MVTRQEKITRLREKNAQKPRGMVKMKFKKEMKLARWEGRKNGFLEDEAREKSRSQLFTACKIVLR